MSGGFAEHRGASDTSGALRYQRGDIGPLNNGQTQTRHRRPSPSSSPEDRFSAKSTKSDTGQLRKNRPCLRILTYSS